MRKSVWRLVAMPSFLVVAVATMTAFQTPAAHAAPATSRPTISSLYVSHGELERSWSYAGWQWTNATSSWHTSGGRLISDAPNWVPNCDCVTPTNYAPAWVWQGAQRALGQATTAAPTTTRSYSSPAQSVFRSDPVNVSYSVSSGGSYPLRTAIGQWNSTGYGAWRGNWGSVGYYGYGSCTWGAAHFAHDNVSGLGDAYQWAANAASRGLPTGYTPAVGATVVFQPGVQGASGLGHVGHVVGVYGGGWFMIEETSFWWNGGGFATVSYRYAHAGAGVSFIY